MKKHTHLAPSRIILLGFMGMILCGALLLMLPISSKDGNWTRFLDALFTSTSASCVTGLTIFDTYTHWSLFGQFVIILLIQIGGLGVVTIGILLASITGKKIGLRSRTLMRESIDAPHTGGMVRITGFIFKGTILIEMVGALLLSIRFIPEFGFFEGIWYSVFHAVSAFCNAGFDLMGQKAPFSSLTSYSQDGLVLGVIGLLIIIGGLGFFVWDDLLKNKMKYKKFRLQTKIVLVVTSILLILPMFYFFFYEFAQPEWGFSLTERFWPSIFESITPRTAGFYSVDYNKLHDASFPIYNTLMLIGGSSGSTAGGFKTTTLAVLVMTLVSLFSRKNNVEVFNRRLANDAIIHTIAILALYLGLFLAGGILLCIFDGVTLTESYFEVASALGTVGLSLGITPYLSSASHIVLIILMYLGRVGSLTLLTALAANHLTVHSQVPEEHISIG